MYLILKYLLIVVHTFVTNRLMLAFFYGHLLVSFGCGVIFSSNIRAQYWNKVTCWRNKNHWFHQWPSFVETEWLSLRPEIATFVYINVSFIKDKYYWLRQCINKNRPGKRPCVLLNYLFPGNMSKSKIFRYKSIIHQCCPY